MSTLWQAFAAAFMASFQPFRTVFPMLMRSMAVSVLLILAGVGTLCLGDAITQPGAPVVSFIGEVLLLGSAVLSLAATVRVAWTMLKVTTAAVQENADES